MSSALGDEHSQTKKKWKDKIISSTNINTGLFDDLQVVISSVDLLNEDVSNDYSSVLDFTRKGFVSQCVQGWSYYAQVNNHVKFAETTVKLSKFIAVLNSDSSVQEHGVLLIRDILANYCKVLYRGISSMRPSTTNSIFRLMQEIVSFNEGQLIDDFLTYFDLTLPALLKVLNPKKNDVLDVELIKKNSHMSMRGQFILFWLALIKYSSPILRKQILTENPKIMNSWIKHLPKMDSTGLIKESLHVLTQKVLKEHSFRKSTKCKILNELVSNKLHELYYSSDSDLVTSVDQFFRIYGSDYEFGIVFQNKLPWFDDSNMYGGQIKINEKEFKLHNKLIYTSLTYFKPWEDDLQCNTVVTILGAAPELVAPYCTYLASMGSHDPKMTAYWFGLTLFIGRVIKLPVPETIVGSDFKGSPVVSIVMESIMPSMLNKNSFLKCLQHEIPLLRQMGCQLLIFALQKLKAVLNLYEQKGWESEKILLLNSFFPILPDISIIGSVLNDTYLKYPGNKNLTISLTLILELFSNIFPNFFSLSLPSTNCYTDIMNNDSFTGIDLVILDNFLKFQGLNNTQIKWWNASNGNHSLFTSLLKVASSKNTTSVTSSKISMLLHSLLEYNIIFNMDSMISSPLYALVASLSVVLKTENKDELQEVDSIWNLLDETISRCYKTPYKYVDQANVFERVSPFLVAIVEQLSYVPAKNEHSMVIKWLLIFMRNMIILGENLTGISKLMQQVKPCIQTQSTIYFNFSDQNLIELSNANKLLFDSSESSFFNYMSLASSNELQHIKRFPVNSFDASAIVFRLHNMIINAGPLTTNTKKTIDLLLSIIGNFALSSKSYRSALSKKKYFCHLIPLSFTNLTQESFRTFIYTINGLHQMLLQLETCYNEFEDLAFELLIELNDHIPSKDVSMSRNILISIISSQHASAYLEHVDLLNDENLLTLLAKVAKSGIAITGHLFLELLKRPKNVQSALLKVVDFSTIDNLDLDLLASSLVEKDVHVFEDLLKVPGIVPFIFKYLEQFTDFEKNLLVACYLESDSNATFIKDTIKASLNELKNCSNWTFSRCLKLFVKHYVLLSTDDIDTIFGIIFEKQNQRYISEVADFLLLGTRFKDSNVQLWLNKSALYITKYLAEIPELSADFASFLDLFQTLIKTDKVCECINPTILNSQLEVIFSKHWVKNDLVLKYACVVILGDFRNRINASNLLQIFLNNNFMCSGKENLSHYISFLSSAIIYQLFFKNPSECSNVTVQQKLLERYHGTMNPVDTLLLSVLEHIESVTSVPWTSAVVSWELLDSLSENEADIIGPTPIISKEKEGLVVTISKDSILNTLRNFPAYRPSRPILSGNSIEKNWRNLSELYFSTTSPKNDMHPSYDPLFLLLCVLNNNQLIVEKLNDNEPTSYYYDVKKMIEFGLLQFALCSLSIEGSVSMISQNILQGFLLSLPRCSQLKDKTLYEVLLTKVLYTLDKSKKSESSTKITPLLWVGISRICAILQQPSNPQYEIAAKWVLGSPFIKNKEIPLFNTVMASSNMDCENYYKNLTWTLQTMFEGLKSTADIKLLQYNKCIEWLLNLQNSPYLQLKLRTLVRKILSKIQEIDGGESLLVFGFGSMASLEFERLNLSFSLKKSHETWVENKRSKINEINLLSSRQELLNNRELSIRSLISVSPDKRFREWTYGDESNIVKRLCK